MKSKTLLLAIGIAALGCQHKASPTPTAYVFSQSKPRIFRLDAEAVQPINLNHPTSSQRTLMIIKTDSSTKPVMIIFHDPVLLHLGPKHYEWDKIPPTGNLELGLTKQYQAITLKPHDSWWEVIGGGL